MTPMKTPTSQSGFFNPRVLLAFAVCSLDAVLLRKQKNNELSMVRDPFSLTLSFPANVWKAISPSFGIITSVLIAAAIAVPSQASAGGAWCTAPYVQVAGPDSSGGSAGGLDIQSLSMGEPVASCSA